MTALRRKTTTALVACSASSFIAITDPHLARAAVIDVVPTDSAQTNIAKIERAAPGDEVVVHPGTYKFRLYLAGRGSAAQPIVIRAADIGDRPVWDLAGNVSSEDPRADVTKVAAVATALLPRLQKLRTSRAGSIDDVG